MHAIGASWRSGNLLWFGSEPARKPSLSRRPIGCYEAADRIAAQYRRDEHAHDT